MAEFTRETITEKVKSILVEHLDADGPSIARSQNLIDDLHADDLDRLEIVIEVEETFDIVIHDAETDYIKTVGDLEDLIAKKLKL